MFGYNNYNANPRRLVVTDLEHVIIARRGKDPKLMPPGSYRLWWRKRDHVWRAWATPQAMVVPNQEIMTADGVPVKVSVAVTVTVTQPLVNRMAPMWQMQLHQQVQAVLRQAVTTQDLESLLGDRTELDEQLRAGIISAAGGLGLEINSVAVRDLMLPGDYKRMLSQVVEARLQGQAALERTRAETAALRNLANAAALVKDNPALFQLRLLEQMASSTGNTYVINTDPPVS